MVLFKRKRVQYLNNPLIHDDAEVWSIDETNELFTDYEEYLRRNDFYRQKRFSCEATGVSGLTFREAQRRELEATGAWRESFPDTLREPILRKVQFNQSARIDHLVDWVYDEFKEDFYPGERVAVSIADERVNALIKEKVKFPELMRENGTIERQAFARYFVEIENDAHDVALFDQAHISRDRKLFSKQRIRALLKDCIDRDSWIGAPWIVHPPIAEKFRISCEIPQHLTQEYQIQMKKMHASEQRMINGTAVKLGRPKGSGKPLDKDLAARASGNIPVYPVSRVPRRGCADNAAKFPIEDLELTPSKPPVVRPMLRFLAIDGPESKSDRTGALLETWNTLNVYCEVYELDSFTFDDFHEALRFYSADCDCELVAEVHCALLRTMVNEYSNNNGQVQISLPIANNIPETPVPHRAAAMELSTKSDWIVRLQKRELFGGRWVSILVGLLLALTHDARLSTVCNRVLARLSPVDREPTWEVAWQQYLTLNVEDRVDILQILCMKSLETKMIRAYLEECANNMTEHRKEKFELKRQWKSSLEELRELETERGTLQPEDEQKPAEIEIADDPIEPTDSSDDEDRPVQSQASRRANLRAEIRRERPMETPGKKLSKEEKRLEKVESKIQSLEEAIRDLEEELMEVDNDLREADCPRTRVIGRDRFWNRYYWLERNGMPYAGLPSSSTARAGYANACIWVQGPESFERQGFIELSAAESQHYARAFGITVPQRKLREEGETSLASSAQWGYLDDPAQLEELMAWLDPRGSRECRLRKELGALQELIAKHMQRRLEYIGQDESHRTSSRTKFPLRCQAWHNTVAVHEYGQLLSEAKPSAPRRPKGVATKKELVEEVPESESPRPSRRSRNAQNTRRGHNTARELRPLRQSL